MTNISIRLKKAMEMREMRQCDLVAKTGINKSSISTYISGDYEPKQKNLNKIAKALDVDVSWLTDAKEQDSMETELIKYYGKLNEQNKKIILDLAKSLGDK